MSEYRVRAENAAIIVSLDEKNNTHTYMNESVLLLSKIRPYVLCVRIYLPSTRITTKLPNLCLFPRLHFLPSSRGLQVYSYEDLPLKLPQFQDI